MNRTSPRTANQPPSWTQDWKALARRVDREAAEVAVLTRSADPVVRNASGRYMEWCYVAVQRLCAEQPHNVTPIIDEWRQEAARADLRDAPHSLTFGMCAIGAGLVGFYVVVSGLRAGPSQVTGVIYAVIGAVLVAAAFAFGLWQAGRETELVIGPDARHSGSWTRIPRR